MSHVTDVGVELYDLPALRRAAARLGLEFCEGQLTYRWYNRFMGDAPLPAGFKVEDLGRCEHALKVPGSPKAYEIGVCRSRTGEGWTLLYDDWQGGFGLEAVAGKNLDALHRAYAEEVALAEVRALGIEPDQQEDEEGWLWIEYETED